jgi:hypothetical protein
MFIDRKDIEREFEEIPFLYHYTTIDTLKLIISNRTLKFNRNDQLNDIIEEVKSPHTKYYVSCFTYCENESLPMWFIYTREKETEKNKESKKNKGVRLRIKNKPFFKNSMHYFGDNGERVDTDISKFDSLLYGKVIYDDGNAERCPSQGTDGLRLTNVIDMGLYCKTTAWDYEKEARFYIIQPNSFDNVKALYIDLKDIFFEELEITFSPLITEDLQHYKNEISNIIGNEVVFKDSILKNRIRLDKL